MPRFFTDCSSNVSAVSFAFNNGSVKFWTTSTNLLTLYELNMKKSGDIVAGGADDCLRTAVLGRRNRLIEFRRRRSVAGSDG